ncbi:MAG: anaerobic ribonucleoside-triphosphate reductase activating protein [Thermodesulfobacteriota bacterium]
MFIAALQKITLSDFPGRVAALLFCQGCNFRCPFCHNGSLLCGPEPGLPSIPPHEVLAYLEKRAGKISGLVISGGEPSLQPELAGFCREVKGLGLAVKLDTNGSQPQVIEDLLAQGLLDFIAMDIKAPLHRYPELAGRHQVDTDAIRASIDIIGASGIDHLFRTTDVTPLLTEEDHRAIAALVPAGSRHLRQPFIAANSLDPSLAPSS